MKNLCYLVLALLAFGACKKQEAIVDLPIEKLYFFEYNYFHDEDENEPYFKFHVIGFCELDSNFNLTNARRLSFKCPYYSDSHDILPDSMKKEISNIILKYPTDTIFCYNGEIGSRIYDGNAYRIIMQHDSGKTTTIKFEPKYLPDDLYFLYSYLYANRKCEHKNTYKELIKMFEEEAKDDMIRMPILKETIKFTPPVIKKK